MCGIFGIIGECANNQSLIKAMGKHMINRGPDGEGYFFDNCLGMGMRRLSIIDLEGGWQPLYSRNKRVIAFQNGEIYNYLELRKELVEKKYIFETSSDTEVLAHGFDAWGMKGLLERLDGMYSIAIADLDSKKLFLGRDRFGEKPLYYCRKKDFFAYSSNLITLAALPGVSNEIDNLSIERYLALHYIPGKNTFFKDISQLLPGGYLTISMDNRQSVEIKKYFEQNLKKTFATSKNELKSSLEKAVRSRLAADVPVGIFLSGGLDSSLIAAIAAKYSPGISTFSMGFSSSKHDESIYAEIVAKNIGSSHHHFIFKEDDFIELLPKVVDALDTPIGDQALLPLYWLCGEASKKVKVVLAGEGADEIFGGYGYYENMSSNSKSLKVRLRSIFRSGKNEMRPSSLIDFDSPISPSGYPLLTDKSRCNLLLEKSSLGLDSWESSFIDWLDTSPSPLKRASAADIATWLPDDLLIKFDRMAMAHSIEGRAPFLMPRLVDEGLNMPDKKRIDKGVGKIALREVATDYLPKEILTRKKQGFVLPMRKWVLAWFNRNGGVDAYLRKMKIPSINYDSLALIIKEDLQTGVNRERLLFALIILFEWYFVSTKKINNLNKIYKNILERV
jgi:asparagine synthase (glutamine-hydrolysing)